MKKLAQNWFTDKIYLQNKWLTRWKISGALRTIKTKIALRKKNILYANLEIWKNQGHQGFVEFLFLWEPTISSPKRICC